MINHNRCFRLMAGLLSAILFLLTFSTQAAQVIQTLPFYDSFDYNPATGLAGASSHRLGNNFLHGQCSSHQQ